MSGGQSYDLAIDRYEEPVVRTIGVADFKAQCLGLLDSLDEEGIVVTKRGKPVARILPYETEHAGLIGSLRDKLEICGDIVSTGIAWDASAQP